MLPSILVPRAAICSAEHRGGWQLVLTLLGQEGGDGLRQGDLSRSPVLIFADCHCAGARFEVPSRKARERTRPERKYAQRSDKWRGVLFRRIQQAHALGAIEVQIA